MLVVVVVVVESVRQYFHSTVIQNTPNAVIKRAALAYKKGTMGLLIVYHVVFIILCMGQWLTPEQRSRNMPTPHLQRNRPAPSPPGSRWPPAHLDIKG